MLLCVTLFLFLLALRKSFSITFQFKLNGKPCFPFKSLSRVLVPVLCQYYVRDEAGYAAILTLINVAIL